MVFRGGRELHGRALPGMYGYPMRACASDDDSLAMIDLMLNDLRGETGERGMALAEFAVGIRHFDALVTYGVAFSLKGKTSFGGVERAVSRGDFGIEHDEDAAAEILIHEGDDALGNADHIRGHADAAIAVCFEGVFEILGHGEILIRVPCVLGRLLQKRDGRHDCLLHALLFSSLCDDFFVGVYGVVCMAWRVISLIDGESTLLNGMSALRWEWYPPSIRALPSTLVGPAPV